MCCAVLCECEAGECFAGFILVEVVDCFLRVLFGELVCAVVDDALCCGLDVVHVWFPLPEFARSGSRVCGLAVFAGVFGAVFGFECFDDAFLVGDVLRIPEFAG
jgi:hypothetical protein